MRSCGRLAVVIKGGARSSPGELAFHLLRADTNEAVNVRGLDGVAASDLRGALLEMAAVGAGARSRRPLYHASINTARDEVLTEAQQDQAIDRLAEELGLTGQPRAVVEHVKAGRSHLHVVWSRIDGETLTAIPDSHNYRKHETVARDLERVFGHDRVQGAHVERDGIERPARTPEPYEMMQAARSGMTPAEAKAELTALWRSTDSGRAFVAAIEEAGWVLARGDKRDFVVIDRAGETHSLARRIDGAKAKEVRARLADIDADQVPTVDQVRGARADRQREAAQPTPEPEPVPEMGGADIPAPSPEATQRPSYEAVPEPPTDLDARFGSTPTDAPQNSQQPPPGQDAPAYVPNFVMVVDLSQVPEDRWGPSPEIDPDAGMVIDATPEPEQLHQVDELDQLDAHRQAFADRQQARADLERENTPQHRQAKPHQVPETEAVRRQEPAHVRQPSAADNDARRAMEDLARTDPLGMAARHGFHAGDRLKTPEDMRREMAERMRSFQPPEPEPVPVPEMGGADIPAPSPEATQRPSYEAKQQGKDRPMGFFSRLWSRVRNFGAAGFPAMEPVPEAEPVNLPPAPSLDMGGGGAARAPDSGPVNARMAADLQPEPKPAPQVDDARAAEIARQIAAGRKAEVYDKDRMRDLSRAHHELKGAAPDIAPAPRRSPLEAMLERVRAAEAAAPTPTPKRGGGRSIGDDDTHDSRRHHHRALWHLLHPFAPTHRPGGIRPDGG